MYSRIEQPTVDEGLVATDEEVTASEELTQQKYECEAEIHIAVIAGSFIHKQDQSKLQRYCRNISN